MSVSLVILIPAFNAAESIADVVAGCRIFTDGSPVLVVDDGSVDDTGDAAERAGARVVRHSANRGKGAALRTGFRAILNGMRCDVVLTLDADRQHDPSEIPKFLAEYEKGMVSIVVGRRDRWKSKMPLSRKISNSVTSFLVSARTGYHIGDSQCGFRLIERRVLETIGIDAEGFEAETEFLIKAAKHGFPLAFVSIGTVYAGEQSHMTHWATTKQFVRTLLREY